MISDILVDYFEHVAQTDPRRTFIRFLGPTPDEDCEITYMDADARAAGFARVLKDNGVGHGDTVCLLGANSPNWVIAYFACQKLGAIANPVNPDLTPSDIKKLLALTAAKLVMTTRSDYADESRTVLLIDPFSESVKVNGLAVGLDKSTLRRNSAIRGDDTLSILFTSGTTGPLPKAVVTPLCNLVRGIESYRRLVALDSDDRLMVVTPLFHASALNWSVTLAVLAGATLLVAGKFSASRFWAQARRGGATVLWTLGAIPFILLRHPLDADEEESLKQMRLIFAAGGGARSAECRARWGRRFHDGWGMSETVGTLTDDSCFDLPDPYPCVGKAVPGIDMAILDPETGEEMPVRQHGEIVTRFGQGFSGYLGNQQAIQESIRNGWFHTGDIGYQDENGRFYFVDRLKDIIRRGGENIASRDVEQAVNSYPGVAEAHALAKPDPELGERVCVFIVMRQGARAPTLEVLREHCSKSLPRLYLPEGLRVVEETDLPRTPSGRVQKAKLKTLLREESRA